MIFWHDNGCRRKVETRAALVALFVIWVNLACPSLTQANVPLQNPTSDRQAQDEEPTQTEPTAAPAKNQNTHLLHRIEGVAILVGVVILMLAILFAYLRMDHATRGFYSGRLQSMAFAAVALVLVMAYLLWTQLMNQ